MEVAEDINDNGQGESTFIFDMEYNPSFVKIETGGATNIVYK